MALSLSVALSPTPGFCLKSSSLQPGLFTASAAQAEPAERRDPSEQSLKRIPIPIGFKVFVNVCWDKNVPPPPPGSEHAIQRAMQGQDVDDTNRDGWFVPVIVSSGHQVSDKAGNPALVFDSVFSSSLKPRSLKDPAFKAFLIELALQRIEAQSSLQLSRTLGAPNIASKGKLLPRTASIPVHLFPPDHPLRRQSDAESASHRLIEELPPRASATATAPQSTPKGILKKPAAESAIPRSAIDGDRSASGSGPATKMETPAWSWTQEGARIRVTVQVPNMKREDITTAALDLEARRIQFHVPGLYALDVDLGLDDTKLGMALALAGAGPHGTEQGLMLKRARALDVEGAEAEWRVAEGQLVLYA
ncbi:pre-RNA processing PIH1/Nop17-domain-containing protein [Amylostereum chailletii]|nr:pre-RNA processing PIH1/Nop17-domain-containing protein [Amylostereum chailletii]